MAVITMAVWALGVLAVILAFVAIGLYPKHELPDAGADTQDPLEWLPPELHYARVAAVEKDMSCLVDLHEHGRVRVHGRPDQVYQLHNGLYVPLEFKNRKSPRVQKTDSDQLSLQAWMLRRNGYQTAPFGVVIFRSWHTGKRRPVVVPLAGDLYSFSLIERYFGISNGSIAPVKAEDQRCNSCGHAQECGAM